MGRKQIFVVAAGISLSVLLYFAPTTPASNNNVKEKANSGDVVAESAYDIQNDVTNARNDMDAESLAYVDGFEKAFSEENVLKAAAAYDSVVTIYDTMRKPDAAAFYLNEKAKLTHSSEDWIVVGERYMILGKYLGEKEQKAAWYGISSTAFRKALELDPENVNVTIDLGVSLIEGATYVGGMPMEGITLLKKAIEMDPKNAKGYFYLGYFAERSGQLEKALERYNKVLEIDPENEETHLYLAQVYEKQGNKQAAAQQLSKFKESLTDPKDIAEVDRQIESLQK